MLCNRKTIHFYFNRNILSANGNRPIRPNTLDNFQTFVKKKMLVLLFFSELLSLVGRSFSIK